MKRQRLRAIVLLLGLVLAACGADDPDTGTNVVGSGVDTDAPDGGLGDGTTGGSGDAPAPGDLPPPAGSTDPEPSATPPPAAPPSTEAPDPQAPAPTGVGGYAGFYLRPAASNRLVVEVSAQDGATPRQATLDHLVEVLAANSNKGVSIDGIAKVGGGATSWTAKQLQATADGLARTAQGQGGAAVLRLLFVHGDFESNTDVLGVAIRSDVAAVFVDQVEAASAPLFGSAAIEDAVTIHETGHLLGLVDLVLRTGRADPEHPGHSKNTGSVMYWAVESSAISQVLNGGPPREFDDADRADLRAIATS